MSIYPFPTLWASVSLGEIAEIVGGGTPSRNSPIFFQGNIPWATPTDVTALDDLWISRTAETISERGLAESSAKLLPAGTVLMTSRATIGFTAIAAQPLATNQGFANLICDEAVLFNEYLAYWLPFIRAQLLRLAAGTTFKEISKSNLARLRVPLPPLFEQKRIAYILREADALRRERRRASERAGDLLGALFQSMFGDPIRDDRGWKKRKLDYFCDITAKLVDPKRPEYAELPLIGGENIESGTGRLMNMRPASDVGAVSNKFLFEKGNILYSKIRPALKKVALPNLRGLCSADIYPIVVNELRATPLFVTQLLNSSHFTMYTHRVSARAQIPKINRDDLMLYETMLPDVELQKEFEAKAVEVLKLRDDVANNSAKLESLYTSLIARAFTGELTATWREARDEQLREEAVQRDIALGLRGTEPTIGDIEAGRVTRAEQEEANRQLAQAMEQFRLIPSNAVQGMLAETFGNLAKLDVSSLLRSNVQSIQALQLDVSELVATQMRPVTQRFFEQLADLTRSMTQLHAESLRTPMLQPSPELTRQLASWFANASRLSIMAELLNTRAGMRDALTEEFDELLDRIAKAPTYFRSETLVGDEMSLIQAEERLRLLVALGIVRPVVVRGQACYRLVSSEREYAVPEGLEP